MKKIAFILSILIGFSSLSFAQKQVRKSIREGNKDYKKENYTDATVAYQQAIEKNTHSTEAAYNLGNAYYRQGKGKEALEQYKAVINNETDKSKLAKAWHNTGNIFLASAQGEQTPPQEKGKLLNQSIEAYKHSLRNNPKDEETRYNLALAQKLRQESQNQDQNQDQDQEQQQDQQQQQEQQQQDPKEQEQKEQEQKEQEQQPQQQNQNQISKETAEQIMEAMMQEEKRTQENVQKQQMQQQKGKKFDKNW